MKPLLNNVFGCLAILKTTDIICVNDKERMEANEKADCGGSNAVVRGFIFCGWYDRLI